MSKGTRSLAFQLVLAAAASGYGCPQLREDDFDFTVATPDAGPPAPTAQQCAPYAICDDACVDTQSNPDNCGACGAAIADGQICSMGTAVGAEVGCGMRTLCDRGCVDTNVHRLFCGSCDVACQLGQRCAMGRCECAPPLAKNCDGACRQCCTQSDCPGDRTCQEGVCELECAAPLSPCTNDCVDLETDPKNCGACRRDCGPGGTCHDGACG